MSRKLFCTVAIAILIFGVVVCSVEMTLRPSLVILGTILGIGLAFGFLNLRNKFFVFLLLLSLLLTVYFTWKKECREIVYSLPAGAVIGLLLVWGWVRPHKPFRRSTYLSAQADGKEDQTHNE